MTTIIPEAKAKVSLNAVKTALTGRTVLLQTDDAAAYQSLIDSYLKTFEPTGPIETGLVQSLVDICWRLDRIPGLEMALLVLGRNKLIAESPSIVENLSPLVLEMHLRTLNEKQFRNLQLQETRLVRRREREMQELRDLQESRKAKETEELKTAAEAAIVAEHNQQPFNLTELGFEFSTQRFATFMARLTPALKQNILKEALATKSAAA